MKMEKIELNGYEIIFETNEEYNPQLNVLNWSGGIKMLDELKKIAADYSGLVSNIPNELCENIVEKVLSKRWINYKMFGRRMVTGHAGSLHLTTAKESFQTLSKLEYCVITKK